MRIKKLELINFKRFTHLTVDMTALEQTPKLVLLIGANGSGKSSVFDGFEALSSLSKGNIITPSYYRKSSDKTFSVQATLSDNEILTKAEKEHVPDKALSMLNQNFYGRSSIRQVPKLTRTNLGIVKFDIENDSDRPKRYIDLDVRFENDIEKITGQLLDIFFKENVSSVTIRDQFLYPINKAFENIFGNNEPTSLRFSSFKPPLDDKVAEILFTKGVSNIPYDFLSSGEKEVFNILLNLLSRKEYFQDTVYFLDELDLHLNTFLQKSLLKEITENWVPHNCQLWTASHSVGFIEYANENIEAAIIDLDNLDFDQQQIIFPSPKNNFDVFEIAVSKNLLSQIFKDNKIFFSENTDTNLYNELKIDKTIFFVGNDKNDVFQKSKNLSVFGLIDRDYLSDEEVENLKLVYPKLRILQYYCLENYLFHPDNLQEHFSGIGRNFEKEIYEKTIRGILIEKGMEIAMSAGKGRQHYPFFKEKENQKKLQAFNESGKSITELLKSDDFETFYKVFPAKDYGKEMKERQNLNRNDLIRTDWIKQKISSIL